MAKRLAVTIANYGRPELVVFDAEEYERLQRLGTRVAMPTEGLDEAELAELERTSQGASDT